MAKHFDTREKLVEFYFMLYFPFDYMNNFISEISRNLMIQHKLKLDPSLLRSENNDITMSNGVFRTKKTCFQKLISIVLNDVRKKIRDKLKKQYELDFTLKNNTVEEHVSKNERRTLNRKPRTLHTWMLQGEFVSMVFTFYDTQLL